MALKPFWCPPSWAGGTKVQQLAHHSPLGLCRTAAIKPGGVWTCWRCPGKPIPRVGKGHGKRSRLIQGSEYLISKPDSKSAVAETAPYQSTQHKRIRRKRFNPGSILILKFVLKGFPFGRGLILPNDSQSVISPLFLLSVSPLLFLDFYTLYFLFPKETEDTFLSLK